MEFWLCITMSGSNEKWNEICLVNVPFSFQFDKTRCAPTNCPKSLLRRKAHQLELWDFTLAFKTVHLSNKTIWHFPNELQTFLWWTSPSTSPLKNPPLIEATSAGIQAPGSASHRKFDLSSIKLAVGMYSERSMGASSSQPNKHRQMVLFNFPKGDVY